MPGANCCMPGCTVSSLRCSTLITFHGIPNRKADAEWRAALIHQINRADTLFNPKNGRICSRHFEETCFKYGPTGKRALIPGSLPTNHMLQKSVETPKTPARKPPQSVDGNKPRPTVSGCDRMEEEEWTVKTEVKTERDTQEPLLVRLPVSQCMTEQHSQEPEVKTEVKTERDTQEPLLVRLPFPKCKTEQHSQEPEVKIEIDVAEEPPLAWCMTEQHSQKPEVKTEVKTEIDVAEEPPLAWCMTQEHSHETEVKIEIDVAEEPPLTWCMTQQHSHDEGSGAESSAMPRDDTTQLTMSPYNSQSASTQDGVSSEGSSAWLDHLNACRSNSLKGESFHEETRTQAENSTGHTTQKAYSCTQCNASFRRLHDLKQHVVTHTVVRPHRCSQCNSSFSYSSQLKRHMFTHTGESWPHRCAQCNSSFCYPSQLKQHMVTHTPREKIYRCTQCSASFCLPSTLKRHLIIHTGERPYRCVQCSASFSDSSTLKQHMVTHTRERPHSCTQCSESFTQLSKLKRHMVTHTC